MKFPVRLLSFLFILAVSACGTKYRLAGSDATLMRMNGDSLGVSDARVASMILPYKQMLDSQMNVVLNTTLSDLVKEQPEGTLNDFVADVVLAYAGKRQGTRVDACVLNYGGLRVPVIERGDIKTGRIYELMPFDNEIALLEISGRELKQLLDHTARYGGWPVSGIRMVIDNGVAEQILINGHPLDISRTYLLATSDYLANGGDGAAMLKSLPKKNRFNYKLRDALIDHLRGMKSNSQPVNVQADGRITVAQPEKVH